MEHLDKASLFVKKRLTFNFQIYSHPLKLLLKEKQDIKLFSQINQANALVIKFVRLHYQQMNSNVRV